MRETFIKGKIPRYALAMTREVTACGIVLWEAFRGVPGCTKCSLTDNAACRPHNSTTDLKLFKAGCKNTSCA